MIIGEGMKKKYYYIIIIILIVFFLCINTKSTYTAYESLIEGNVKNKIGGLKLKINNQDITTNSILDKRVILDNTTWTSTHTREEKISPGSSGIIALELDPTGSKVAVKYEFQFIDKKIDDDKLLTFDTITSDHTLIKTKKDTYTGIITKEELNEKININVEFNFDYINDVPAIEEDNQNLDDLFEIHFHAIQYNNEEIIPYEE